MPVSFFLFHKWMKETAVSGVQSQKLIDPNGNGRSKVSSRGFFLKTILCLPMSVPQPIVTFTQILNMFSVVFRKPNVGIRNIHAELPEHSFILCYLCDICL